MRFKNRNEAAQRLIPLLEKYRNEHDVVIAVPRGGVPIAYEIAKEFNSPLELFMAKKIGHPDYEEFAIGAVGLEDYIVDDRNDVPHTYIHSQVIKIREALKERYKKFMGNRVPIDLNNKVVIIVDDGVATGHTILAAIKMIRHKGARKIVVAVPVASQMAAERIRGEADDFICLYTPEPFIGVGLHYIDFTQVSDEEVIELLNKANQFNNVV